MKNKDISPKTETRNTATFASALMAILIMPMRNSGEVSGRNNAAYGITTRLRPDVSESRDYGGVPRSFICAYPQQPRAINSIIYQPLVATDRAPLSAVAGLREVGPSCYSDRKQ